MRGICAAREIPDEWVNCPVIGHLESRFKLPWGPGNTHSLERPWSSCCSLLKLFRIVERKNICAVQATWSSDSLRFTFWKAQRLSRGLDYPVCQSVSKNSSPPPNRTFNVYLILARLCDALWNVHMHCWKGKRFKRNYPLGSALPTFR